MGLYLFICYHAVFRFIIDVPETFGFNDIVKGLDVVADSNQDYLRILSNGSPIVVGINRY
ncbi:hypothetical protein [Segatella oris]|uniref:hypothetical protein n=1 Tax=Segatella oris TaxID=28135 RepID=UPI0028EFB760|nr:hypothetical protein [Segatella oris]